MNVAGLWSVIAGLGFAYLMAVLAESRFVPAATKRPWGITWLLIGVYVLSSWTLTSRLREDMVADEFAVRIQPTESALELVGTLGIPNTFVITFEPLLIHMLAREPVNVIDFGYLNMKLTQDLLRENPNLTFLYVEQAIYGSPPDRERYRVGFDFLDRVHKFPLYHGDNYAIYRIEVPCCESTKPSTTSGR
jgi:hypothetical protein